MNVNLKRILVSSVACGSFACGCAVDLSAQKSVVLPAEYQNRDANLFSPDSLRGAWWYAGGRDRTLVAFRLQCICDFGASVTGSLSAVSFRRDSTIDTGLVSARFWTEIEVRCSTSALRSNSTSNIFAKYVGKDESIVITRKRVNVLPRPYVNTTPQPFFLTFVFDRKFAYAAKKGSLCLEVRHWNNSLYNVRTRLQSQVFVDAFDSYPSYTGRGSHLSGPTERCFSSKPWAAHPMSCDVDVYARGNMLNMQWKGAHLEANAPAFFFIGASLHPTGIPVTCGRFRLNPAMLLFVISTVTDAFGYRGVPATTHFQLPYDPKSMAGVRLYSQVLSVGPRGKLSASNYYQSSTPIYPASGPDFPVNLIGRTGLTAFTSPSGTKTTRSRGPVMRFQF